jgi:hypothetical protein
LGYRELMEIPIRAFWMMNVNAVRLAAESDLRNLTVFSGGHSSENYRAVRDHLELELGEVVKIDPAAASMEEQIDVDGLNRLRLLSM